MHVHRVTPRANRVSVIFNSFLVNDMVRSAAILRSYTRIQRTVTEIELSPRRLSPRWERQSNFAKTERIHRISMPFSPKPKIRGKDIDTVETMNKTYGFI